MRYIIGIDPDLDHLFDPQQARPAGWCEKCAAEIWEAGQTLCRRCREKEQEAEESDDGPRIL